MKMTPLRTPLTMLRPTSSPSRLLTLVSASSRHPSPSLLHRPWAFSARRSASTSSTPKKSSWWGTFARWGLAFGAVYFYATSPLFEQQPLFQPSDSLSRESTPHTIESIAAEKRKRQETLERKSPASLPESSKTATTSLTETPENRDAAAASTDPAALEEEAGQQGAFNPETGEINWDCPCLGGMAHGPCGEDFKAAFSCFVFSEEDPKGMDCIDKFKAMQECFREHPDVYGAELEPDEEEEGGQPPASLPDGEAEGKPESTTKKSAVEKIQPSEETETVPITEKGSKATSATSANYLDSTLNKGTKPSS